MLSTAAATRGLSRRRSETCRPSADPRKLFADRQVDDACTTQARAGDHHARMLLDGLADHSRVDAQRMGPHRAEYGVRVFTWDERHELALVGHIERVEPQDRARVGDSRMGQARHLPG